MDIQKLIQTITEFALAVIVALVPVLIRYYAPAVRAWLEARAAELQARATDSELAIMRQAARLAVAAVEQLKKNGAILDNDHAFTQAQAYTEQILKSRGILLDLTELRAVIESAVKELDHAKPPAPPAPLANLPAGRKWE